MKFILASQSPRRRDILEMIGLNFTVEVSPHEEIKPDGHTPEELILHNAEAKAQTVAVNHPDSLVIGADTIGVFQGEILEKPVDRADAKRMLKLLQGQEHTVITAVTLIFGDQKHTHIESTQVQFLPLTDSDIEHYLDTEEYADKAAAYAIQGKGAAFVKGVQGDYLNVVGFPLQAFNLMLQQFDINLMDHLK